MFSFFFFKQKTAYEMRISDWSSDVCSSDLQGAGVTFRRSNAGRRDKTFSLIARADHSNYDAFDAFTGTLSARWSYDSTPIWQQRLTYSYGVDLIGTNESVDDFNAGARPRGTYGIHVLPGQVQFDTSKYTINNTRKSLGRAQELKN